MRLPAGYRIWDSLPDAPDETWSSDGHGVVILDRERLSDEQIASTKAWDCQKGLGDRTVYMRTVRGGDNVRTYQVWMAWEESPNDWIYVVTTAAEYTAHRDQFAAMHTLLP